jgi:hypothetical protein
MFNTLINCANSYFETVIEVLDRMFSFIMSNFDHSQQNALLDCVDIFYLHL